jgi:transglutaminase superfamily protein
MPGRLLRKTKSFASIPWSTKLLFAEAVITSAYVKATLLFLPFRKVVAWLGSSGAQAGDAPSAEKIDLIKKVKFALKLCDRYTPWPTECYTSSLTAKIMLKRRKLASTLFFGFRKDEKNSLKGHSWLQCSGEVVTGWCDFSQYHVHSSFS